MTKENLLKFFDSLPTIIDDPFKMEEPNSPITVHEGEFTIKDDLYEERLKGIIQFNWYPDFGVRFLGKPINEKHNLASIAHNRDNATILIDGLEFGEGFITNVSISSDTDENFVKGRMEKTAILGDRSIAVSHLLFSIPNLRNFNGSIVKKVTKEKISSSTSRILLEDKEYIITIDKCNDFKQRADALKDRGGYIILYNGKIEQKKEVSLNQILKTLFIV